MGMEITKKNAIDIAKLLTECAKANPNKDTKWIIKDGMKNLTNDEQKKIHGLLD